MKKFEVGAMYWDTSAVDHNDVMVIKITRRTEKSVWFVRMRGDEPEGEPARTKIFTNANYEYIMPYRYSMAPVWEADRKVEPEADEQAAPETETPDAPANNAAETEPATDNKEEPKITTLLDVHTMNLSETEDEEIFSVKVLWNGGDSWIEYADTAEAMNEWGADKAVSAWEIDNGTLNVWLAQPAQEAPDAGEPDALEVVRILGGTLNLIKDNGNELEAMKARVALWEQVDEFKRRGVALNVEYDADGRFVGVTEPKAGMKFDEFPESVQAKVKEYLRAYDDCSVTYERGAYRVSVGVGITARYAPDFTVCGRYAADDIFTPEERVLNYANSFYSYPPEYCGERDYRMMRAAQERGATLEYDSAGNIVAAA